MHSYLNYGNIVWTRASTSRTKIGKLASKQKQALKWLVGLRKLRSSKKAEILQVILVLQVESWRNAFFILGKRNGVFLLFSPWNYLLISTLLVHKVGKIFRCVTSFYQHFFVSDKISYYKTNSDKLV